MADALNQRDLARGLQGRVSMLAVSIISGKSLTD